MENDIHSSDRFEVAIIGAGFGGIAAAHQLQKIGIDDFVICERNEGVGGTWRDNSYPGAACDVPSHLYSLSFAPNPYWSATYGTQPEILAYIQGCYERFGILSKVRTSCSIVSMRWDDASRRWKLLDAAGRQLYARFVVSATGMFHTPATPQIPGLAQFGGAAFHSARWDHTQDLRGRHIAVIGSGASAIQVIPAIADLPAKLDVYQRSAPWVLPRNSETFTPEQQAAFSADPTTMAGLRQELYDFYENATTFVKDHPMVDIVVSAFADFITQSVPDSTLRAKLMPNSPFGCKRTLISNDYYPSLQRSNVEVVSERIVEITATGVRTDDGQERSADTLIFCTGFHASDYLRGIEVIGRDGANIHSYWNQVPRAYQGMLVPGFPNFFMFYGPNTNQGGNSIILIHEAQALFLASALTAVKEHKAESLEVTEEAMDRFMSELRHDLEVTTWSAGCSSYFHNEAGDIVTQLPWTAGRYSAGIRSIQPQDFRFS